MGNWSYVKCSGFLEQLPNLKNGNETDERPTFANSL